MTTATAAAPQAHDAPATAVPNPIAAASQAQTQPQAQGQGQPQQFPQAPIFSSTSGSATQPVAPSTAGGGASAAAVPGLSSASAAAVAARGTPATLNLDDIFGDCFFTPDGDTVFLSDQAPAVQNGIIGSGEAVTTTVASKPVAAPTPAAAQAAPVAPAAPTQPQPTFVPVAPGAGISSTNLDKPGAPAHAMTAPLPPAAATAPTTSQQAVPFAQPPQRRHHLQYATPAVLAAQQQQAQAAAAAAQQQRQAQAQAAAKKRGRGGGMSGARQSASERKMSDQQKVERRERNREHAKRSRIRKKFLLESLQQSVALLKEENEKLRGSIRTHLGDKEADELLSNKNLADAQAAGGLIANSANDANKVLDDPDFSFIKALQTAQQNFVVTDPSLPDNPIVYATQGFLNLTGYTLDQVLGRNCRFLQGPETDPKAVEKIRKSIEDGTDMSVCLLNYRVDGTTFWNQFFIAALRDAGGNITNYVGVQCKVSDQYAANVCKKQEEADAAAAAAEAEGGAEPMNEADGGEGVVSATADTGQPTAPPEDGDASVPTPPQG